ncbi:MAG: LytR/AlgR family response regulator transcription factor [Gemmatimonadota bacterium]
MSRQNEGMVRRLLRRPMLVLSFGLALALALIADVSGGRIADGYALGVTMPGWPVIAAVCALGAVWLMRRRARTPSNPGVAEDAGAGEIAVDVAADARASAAAVEGEHGRRAAGHDRDRSAVAATDDDDPDSPVERIAVRARRAIALVDVDDISHVEAAGRYARIHTADRDHLAQYSLSDLERMLDPTRFVRVHRSTIVNLGRIRSLRTVDYRDFDLLLDDGATVRLSRNYRARFEAAIGLSI